MPKFNVCCNVLMAFNVEIEANSEEDAWASESKISVSSNLQSTKDNQAFEDCEVIVLEIIEVESLEED